MTPEDKPQFFRAMTVLAETFKEPMTDLRLEGYWLGLSDLSVREVEHAAAAAVRGCKFFPRPAELRELARGGNEDDTEQAWQTYKRLARSVGGYESPQLDAALAETLVLVFGSWQAACWADFTPEMWAAKRKEFGRTYQTLKHRGLAGTATLLGAHDEHNVGLGAPPPGRLLSE